MAEAVAERLGKRQGERSDLATSGNISLSDKGQTRDLAAAKAGLGSGKRLEAAQKVLAHGKGCRYCRPPFEVCESFVELAPTA